MELDDMLYSNQEAADIFGCSVHAIRKWENQGRLRRTKIGSRTMVRKSDLIAFIKSCNPTE